MLGLLGNLEETFMASVRVADEVWIVTALLHQQHPDRSDFSVREIVLKAKAEKVAGTARLRPGVQARTPTLTVLPTRRPTLAGIGC